MQKETLQSLLKQISQERANAVELKEKKEQESLDNLKQGIKDFIESFRKEFYPLISEDIDPHSIGTVTIEHTLETKYHQPTLISLTFYAYWKKIEIKFDSFMFSPTMFEEYINDPKENIIESFSNYNSTLTKHSKKLYEFFVEGKEELIQKVYDEIHKNILRYNQRTIEITESLK